MGCDRLHNGFAVRRGTARSWDHAQFVQEQWLHVARTRMELFVVRVGSKDNIADFPPRRVHFYVNVCQTFAVLQER